MGNCCDGEASHEERRFHAPDMANYRALLRAIHRSLDVPPEPTQAISIVERPPPNSPPPALAADGAADTALPVGSAPRRPVSAMRGTRAAVAKLQFSAASNEPFALPEQGTPAASTPPLRPEDVAVPSPSSSVTRQQPLLPRSATRSLNPHRTPKQLKPGATPPSEPAIEGFREASMVTPQASGPPTPAPEGPPTPLSLPQRDSPPEEPANAIETVGAAADKPGATPLFPDMGEPRSQRDSPPPAATTMASPPPRNGTTDDAPPTLTLQQSAAMQQLITADQLQAGPANAVPLHLQPLRVKFPPEIMATPAEEVKHIPLAKLWKQRRLAQLSGSPSVSPGSKSTPTPSPAQTPSARSTSLRPTTITRPRTPPSDQPSPANNSFDNSSIGMTPHVMVSGSGFSPF